MHKNAYKIKKMSLNKFIEKKNVQNPVITTNTLFVEIYGTK